MAKSLKINGMQELNALRSRVKRQHARNSIGSIDARYILDHLNLVEARIVSMEEKSPDLERESSFG